MSTHFKNIALSGGLLACMVILASRPAFPQSDPSAPQAESEAELTAKVKLLSASLEQTRAELSETRSQMQQLQETLNQMMQKLGEVAGGSSGSGNSAASASSSSVTSPSEASPPAKISQDDWQIINTKVDDLAQEKVESNLKYRLRLSGMVLFNSFANFGQVDNVDVPTLALPRTAGETGGSVGASLRQSIVGLGGVGPDVLGARTSGDVAFDFFGGLPTGYAAASSGLVRLRTARIHLDWQDTSVVGGLDVPFFSPNMPSSYMSVAVPAFAAAGNLWTWTPGIQVEHSLNTNFSLVKFQAGVMDPAGYANATMPTRSPSAGESSRRPTVAARVSANGRNENNPVSLGASVVYSRQEFFGGQIVSGWGGMTDWKFPLFKDVELSGELFTGRGLDSFGAAPDPVVQSFDADYYLYGAPALAETLTYGGWSQLKYKMTPRNEFNFSVGTGGRDSSALRSIAPIDPALAALSPRNQMWFVNYIVHPWSDFVFSTEYRQFRTYPLSGAPARAGQLGFATGFLF
jgi:hypothetical protein